MCKSTEVPSYGCHPSEFGRGGPAGSSTFGGDVSAIAGLMTWSPLDYMNKTNEYDYTLEQSYRKKYDSLTNEIIFLQST